MMFARQTLKKHAWMLLAVCLLTALFAIGAQAQDDPIEFTLEAAPTEFTGPGEMTVSLRVSNTGNTDMLDPVVLLDPQGNAVPSFGDNGSIVLGAGKYLAWTGTYQVTEKDLDQGQVVYTIEYNLDDGEGNIAQCQQQGSVPLTYKGERVRLGVTRTLNPEVVRQGKTAGVTYQLVNNGNVKLTSIKLTEKLTGKTQTVEKLGPGDQKILTFTTRMGSEDLKSAADITYKVEGDTETQTYSVPEVIIPLAKPNLSVTLEAVGTTNVGETAVLRMTFINSGNVSYSDVVVRDQKKGEVLSGVEVPAGATVVKDVEFVLDKPEKFKFTAFLPDNTGEKREMSTDEVTVQVFDPEKSLKLTLDLTCDKESISQTGETVRFFLTVTNNSSIPAKDISVTHGQVKMFHIDELAAGKAVKLEWDVAPSQAGKFQFTASAKDGLGNLVKFDSNVYQLMYVMPTAAPTDVPVVTPEPLVTQKAPTLDDVNGVVSGTRNALLMVAVVLGGVLVLSFLLFVVSSIVRGRKKAHSENAYDHLELAGSRDYTEERDDSERTVETEEIAEETPEHRPVKPMTEEKKEDALPHEKMLSDLAGDEDAPQPEVTAEDVLDHKVKERERVEDPYEDTGFKVSRGDRKTENEKTDTRHRRAARPRSHVDEEE